MSAAAVRERALNGSNKYKNKDYVSADADYSYCIDNADSNDCDSLANYYSNRAATRLQLNRVKDALEDSNSCICVRPTWFKGYSRKGGCLVRLGKLQEAIYAYEKALELEPNNYDNQKALDSTRRRLNGGTSSSSSPFSSFPQFNSPWIAKAKDMISLFIAKANMLLAGVDSNTKKVGGMVIVGLLVYYFMFRKKNRYDYYDDDSYGSYGRSSGMSWTTWGLIMAAAYYLPPFFPQLGQYSRPFFGMNFTTFMYLLQMLQGRGMGMGMPEMGGGFPGFGGGRRNRRYY